MLVTFTTDSHADITMFGKDALAMLNMMGHSTTVPGALVADEVPAALARLTAAIEAQQASLPSAESGYADEQTVSMKLRAMPLMGLLAAAAKAKAYVMWE